MDGPQDAAAGPIARVIAACAQNRTLTILTVLAAGAWGIWSLQNTALDAIPDLSDVQVIVFTEWPGQSPDLVEDQITYPISTRLLAAPEVRFVRGQSFFGLSFVYAIFEDGTDLYWARSRVLEYLSGVQGGSSSTPWWIARARSTSRTCGVSRTGTCAMRSKAYRA